jgi:predicted Fe-Mo cluster-binding NifX family protein
MKIAAVSEDLQSVAQHFGRAPYYVVITVEDGKVVGRETRPKPGHRDFVAADPGPAAKHGAMAGPISDCTALLAGGMGSGAFAALEAAGIAPVLTDETDIETAVLRHVRGELRNLAERVHEHRGEGHHGHGS